MRIAADRAFGAVEQFVTVRSKGRLSFRLFRLPLLPFEVLHGLDDDFRAGDKIVAHPPLERVLRQVRRRGRGLPACPEPWIEQIPGARRDNQQQGQEEKAEASAREVQMVHVSFLPPFRTSPSAIPTTPFR